MRPKTHSWGGKRDGSGRPQKAPGGIRTNIYLYERHLDWLKKQPRPMSETIQSLIQSLIDAGDSDHAH